LHPAIEEISAVVGKENTILDCSEYAVDGIVPKAVASPSTLEEASKVLAAANREVLAVSPRGSGTKLHIGSIPSKLDLVLLTIRLDRVKEYEPDDLTCTVEAGVKLSELQKVLGKRGQFLPLDPPFASRCTIGGTVAANASGPSRLKYGSARDLVIGIKFVLPTGEVAKAGGKVVKNVAGYDLRKLYIGSLGTLGLIGELTFKVHPLPDWDATFVAKLAGHSEACSLVSKIINSHLQPTCLEILDAGAAQEVLNELGIEIADGGYAVMVNFSSVRAAVERQLRDVEGLASGVGATSVLNVENDRGVWSKVTDLLGALLKRRPNSVVGLKTAIVISKVGEMLAKIKGECGPGVQNFNVCHAGSGIIYTYLLLDKPEASVGTVQRMVESLRGSAFDLGGSLVVEYAPLAIKRAVSCWGPTRSDFILMRGIKEAFDPKGIMNPGRFVGGL